MINKGKDEKLAKNSDKQILNENKSLFMKFVTNLGLIHMRHFGTQFCDKKIKRY